MRRQASAGQLFDLFPKLRQYGLEKRGRNEQTGVAQSFVDWGGGFQRAAPTGESDEPDGSDHRNGKGGGTATSRAVVDDHPTAGTLQSHCEYLVFARVELPRVNGFGYRDIGSDPQPGRVPDRVGGAVAARACLDFKGYRGRNHNLGGQGFDQIEPLDASQGYQR